MPEERCLALLQGTVPDAVTFGAAAEASSQKLDTVGCHYLPFAVFWNVMPMFQVILDISVTIVTLVLVMVPLLIASYDPQACNSAMRWMEAGEKTELKDHKHPVTSQ